MTKLFLKFLNWLCSFCDERHKRGMIVLVFLLITSTASGATQQVMVSGTENNLPTSSTEYINLIGSMDLTNWSTSESHRVTTWPANGEITDLRIELSGSPSTGDSYAFSIRVNEATPGDALTCTISNAETSCNDLVNSTTISAGDTVGFEVNPDSSPDARDAYWSVIWNPTTPDETVLGGLVHNSLATSGTQYLHLHATSDPETSAWDKSTLFPTNGTLKSLYAYVDYNPDNGAGVQSRTFTVGGIDCTISEAEKTCNSAADTQAVVAGEAYNVVSTASGTPLATRVYYGIVFVPDTSGQFTFHATTDDNLPGSATEYNKFSGGYWVWSGTEATFYGLANAFTIKNFYAEVETDPGAATETFDFTLRIDGADQGLTCQVTGDVHTCNDTADIAVSDGDRLTNKVVPASAPAVGDSRFAWTGYIAPTGGEVERRVMVVN